MVVLARLKPPVQSDQLSPIGADMTSSTSLSLSIYITYYFMGSPVANKMLLVEESEVWAEKGGAPPATLTNMERLKNNKIASQM